MTSDLKKLPKHIAFIIDGNGRWAKAKGLTRSMGHRAGFKNLEKMIKECFYGYGIPVVSIYAFSTENWNRPQKEVDYLINLFRKAVDESFSAKYPRARLNIMGDYTKFPEDLANACRQTMQDTANNTEFILNLGLNYSGQDEIVKAVNDIITEGIESVDRETIANHLYTAGQPALDFCIRTSGEHRLSNFMLWQIAYSELYFPKVHWPAFSKKDLKEALLEYQSRDRRFGAIKE